MSKGLARAQVVVTTLGLILTSSLAVGLITHALALEGTSFPPLTGLITGFLIGHYYTIPRFKQISGEEKKD